jgi:hypothetical protein
MTQHIVTANLLGKGQVVYLTWDGGWSEQIAESFISSGEEEDSWLLGIAARAAEARIVVDPYLIEVTERDGTAWPVQHRERIRATGPTIAYAPSKSHSALRRVA